MTTDPQVISFKSGKGGAGKTTVVTAMTYLLAEIGFKCLLIDFDLATNGCTYFFLQQLNNEKKNYSDLRGIWEFIEILTDENRNSANELKAQISDCNPFMIQNNFYFFPSRTGLGKKGKAYEQLVGQNVNDSFRYIIDHFVSWAKKNDIHFIFIDCPAGYSVISDCVVQKSKLLIYVLEYDAISNLAIDNLKKQLSSEGEEGANLEVEEATLCNKININERRVYDITDRIIEEHKSDADRENKKIFTRLSPLPYDINIRERFKNRVTPLIKTDLTESPLLLAIFPTMKDIFEILEDYPTRGKIQEYEIEHIRPLYYGYRDEIEKLDKELEGINKKFSKMLNRKLKIWRKNETQHEPKQLTVIIKEIYKKYDQFVCFLLAYDHSKKG